MLTKIGTLLVAFFNDNIPVALAINFGTQPLKAAVVAVAIWLSFMMSLRELDVFAAHCVIIAGQFFNTVSTGSVYWNTPSVARQYGGPFLY